jgi:hypothetical protein
VYPDIWDKEVKAVGLDKVAAHIKKKYAATHYQDCKNGAFAVGYGAIDRADGTGTADRTFKRPGSHARLKARFSNKERLNQECIRFSNIHGYVETIPDRSINATRGYTLLVTRTEWGKILETVPLNYKIQGSAMWWTAKAMTRCQDQLDEWRKEDGFDGRIVLQVHDELVFDFPKVGDPVKENELRKRSKKPVPRTSNLWRIRRLAELMEMGGWKDYGIPTPVNVEHHPVTWAEGVSL